LLEDGVDEDEAVAIALWNNAAFHGDLAALGIARGDLVEAGLLPNPVLSLVFPGTGSTRSGTLSIPIQILQRRTRVAIAKLDAEHVAQSLLRTGLGLAHDVRVAFAELAFARERETLVGRDAALLAEIRLIAEAQLLAGAISELEAARVEADALTAVARHQDAMRQSTAAKYRFLRLLGLPDDREVALHPEGTPPAVELLELAALVDLALASRPDLRAAELAVEAAGATAHWERQQIYDFMALVDIDEPVGEDLATGPGLEIALPIFDRNQGGRLRATARIEQTSLRYLETARAVVLDVRENHAAYLAAFDAAEVWRRDIVPRLETAMEDTERARGLGSVSDLAVLQAEQHVLAARVAGAEARMELMRATSALGYSVGQKIEGVL
jgi:cobalt-zinc-cadmium efflux system outer membrane protein